MIRRGIQYLPFVAENLVVAINTNNKEEIRNLLVEMIAMVLPYIKK